MDQRELFYRSLRHEPGCPVPSDVFEGWMWPGMVDKLKDRLKAASDEDLLVQLGVANRWVTPYYTGPALPPGAKDRIAGPHTVHSLNGAIWGIKPGIHEHGLGSAGHPLARANTPQDLAGYPWPSAGWFDFDGMRASALSHAGYFVTVGGFSPLFYLIADLCGMEKALIDLVDKPDLIEALVEQIVQFYRDYFTRIAIKGRGCIDAIAFGDDFASQLNMLMHPRLWRRYFKPAWAELFAIARQYGYVTMFHSCGSVYQVIPDLIEIGLDVLYPVQPQAVGMDLAQLKQKYGKAITFSGGIDVQDLLPFKSPQEVRAEVRRLRDLFAEDGGFILTSSHVIMDDFPIENVLALYD